MLHLDFTEEEEATLREEVKNRLRELDVEIHRTDSLEYKTMLKHRRDLLQQVSDKLLASTGMVA